MVRPMEELIGRLRAIVGEEWCFTQEHQLRTYESDGLLQYAVRPGVAVLPGDAEQVQACVRACAEAGVAVGRARLRLGPLRRRAAARRRRADRHLADDARSSRSTSSTSACASSRA